LLEAVLVSTAAIDDARVHSSSGEDSPAILTAKQRGLLGGNDVKAIGVEARDS
jgi:hypothetical protein